MSKSRLSEAADVIDLVASVGEKVGTGLGGVAGTVTTVVSIGASIVAALLRLDEPIVRITEMRDALTEAHKVESDVEAELRKAGVI
jgi:hypothetical protein